LSLSTAEKPREKESRGGDEFTRHDDSKHHQCKPSMVVLQTKTLFSTPWKNKKINKESVTGYS